MKNNIIERTDGGYILRLSRGNRIAMIFGIIFFGIYALFGVIFCAAAISEGEWDMMVPGAFLILFGSILGLLFLYTMWGVYLEIDREGVHLHRELTKTRHILWREVQDWGVAYQNTKGGPAYYLYFATEVLEVARWGRSKKLPMRSLRAVSINIPIKHLHLLRRMGVIRYCREHLNEEIFFFSEGVPLYAKVDE